MRKRTVKGLLAAMLAGSLLMGCGGGQAGEAGEDAGSAGSRQEADTEQTGAENTGSGESGAKQEKDMKTEIQVFIAASLNTVMTELAKEYSEIHPEVKITYNADSSGTLLTQIEEGYECDLFFSAAQKQMDQLESDGLVMEGTRANVVNNQVVVVTRKDSGTEVTGLESLGNAESIALAGGSVPAGRYTRQALVSLGMLEETEDAAGISTEEVSRALGGAEISEQDNVSKVLAAVIEGSCEVGTTYYSDTYGYEDDLEILETVSYDLTGNVIYPIAQVVNEEADDAQRAAAAEFLEYILSDEARAVFASYYFDTDV